MRGFVGGLLLSVIVLSHPGCGGGTPRYTVSGTVTFDGQPVERGEVSLAPDVAAQAPEGGPIEAGRFHLQVTAGKKIVRIRASRPLPPERQDNPAMGLLYEDYIPARYNRDSTLTVEVTPRGKNVFTFELTGKE